MTDLPAAEKALIDLAAAMRGWNRQDLWGALLAAKQAGWDFGTRTVPYVARLLAREDGAPSALRHAAANPLRPVPDGPGESTYSEGAARARDLFARRRGGGGAAV